MGIRIEGPITFGRKSGMTSLLEKLKKEDISLPFSGTNIITAENQHLVGDIKPVKKQSSKSNFERDDVTTKDKVAEDKKAEDIGKDDDRKPIVRRRKKRRRKKK